MADSRRAFRATAITASAQLGGTERVLLDFAVRAFEYDIALRVLAPRDGPLVEILNGIGVPASVVPAPESLLRSVEHRERLRLLPGALIDLGHWAAALAAHPHWGDADVLYTVAFKAHVATSLRRRHPVVWHLHEMPTGTLRGLWRLASRWAPDALIVNSRATAAAWRPGRVPTLPLETPTDAATHRSAAPPLHVISNGVDLDRFRPSAPTAWIHQALGIPRSQRLLGMPAVLAAWKGQFETIEAFQAIRDSVPDVDLVFVGGSIYDTAAEEDFELRLQRRIAAANQTADRPRIHLLPFQAKIEHTFPEFAAALHYSRRPEAFGRVIVEAMASGVPVLAAAEGGPLEILGSAGRAGRCEAGWLVPPRKPAALADTLREALRSPAEVLRAMGAAGRRRAEDHFSARRFAKDVADVLRRAAFGIPPGS